jgi:hypothetical protein
MREACIILPYASEGPYKYGKLARANAHLRSTLVSLWGGYTKTQGSGAWYAPTGDTVIDQINIYTVAMEDSWQNNRTLET